MLLSFSLLKSAQNFSCKRFGFCHVIIPHTTLKISLMRVIYGQAVIYDLILRLFAPALRVLFKQIIYINKNVT